MQPSALILAGPEDLGPFLSQLLEKFTGCRARVLGAHGGLKDVLAALSQNRCDLLLVTDNTLGPASIREMVSGVRSAYPGLAILVVSAATEPEYLSDVVQRGADEFIVMPFDLDELLASVKRLCQIE